MKIEGTSLATSQLPADRTKQASGAGATGTQGAAEDRTTFHSDSLSVQSLTSQALTSPEVRQGKVDTLSQSVSSGEYQVNATNIAGAIADHYAR
jgi:flagellar biosynthesis anti-sigma factor FlgM